MKSASSPSAAAAGQRDDWAEGAAETYPCIFGLSFVDFIEDFWPGPDGRSGSKSALGNESISRLRRQIFPSVSNGASVLPRPLNQYRT